MDIRNTLKKFKKGELDEKTVLGMLGPTQNLGFARIDHQREIRKGFPEVVYGAGKSHEHLLKISSNILKRSGRLLITRTNMEAFAVLQEAFPHLKYSEAARCIFHAGSPGIIKANALKKGRVLVACAGTTDIPVAEEAALTARMMGCRVETLFDVGVAGLHRLLEQVETVRSASVLVAVAGMEAALPSVLGGLVDTPLVAIPTSVGYGASFGGLAALLAMLNCCAPGVTVVNIDNGFGGGYAAAQILRMANRLK